MDFKIETETYFEINSFSCTQIIPVKNIIFAFGSEKNVAVYDLTGKTLKKSSTILSDKQDIFGKWMPLQSRILIHDNKHIGIRSSNQNGVYFLDSILQIPSPNSSNEIKKIEILHSEAEQLLYYLLGLEDSVSNFELVSQLIEKLEGVEDIEENHSKWDTVCLDLTYATTSDIKWIINNTSSEECNDPIRVIIRDLEKKMNCLFLNENDKMTTDVNTEHSPAVLSSFEFKNISHSDFSPYICTISKETNDFELWELDGSIRYIQKFSLEEVYINNNQDLFVKAEITSIDCVKDKLFMCINSISKDYGDIVNELACFLIRSNSKEIGESKNKYPKVDMNFMIWLELESVTTITKNKNSSINEIISFDEDGDHILLISKYDERFEKHLSSSSTSFESESPVEIFLYKFHSLNNGGHYKLHTSKSFKEEKYPIQICRSSIQIETTFFCLFSNGTVEIWSLEDLNKISSIEPFADDPCKIISFCSETQRLCCCTENGFIVSYSVSSSPSDSELDEDSDDNFIEEDFIEDAADLEINDDGLSKKVYSQRFISDLFPILENLNEITSTFSEPEKCDTSVPKQKETAKFCEKIKAIVPLKKDVKSFRLENGTGYGFGSTNTCWNIEKTLNAQSTKEEQLIVIFQFTASLLERFRIATSKMNDEDNTVHDLLKNSNFIPSLASFLRNDSILEIMRNVTLYRAILKVIRSIIDVRDFLPLLTRNGNIQGISFLELLKSINQCMDMYLKCLGHSKVSTEESEITSPLFIKEENIEVFAAEISETTNHLQANLEAQKELGEQKQVHSSNSNNLEEIYIHEMRKLQFMQFEIIDQSYKFNVSYRFQADALKIRNEVLPPARMKRLAQEAVTLSTSLPLTLSSSVFVRCDNDRMDILKVLITGPSETPYANGCFEFDVFFPADYPQKPILVKLVTTGRNSIRFNPNLYNCGKVCLSILNTWNGRPEEKWNPQSSNVLQVLVSIQSLIFVEDPYFNEPGYEMTRGTTEGDNKSKAYNSQLYTPCILWAMLDQIKNGSPCFKEIIHNHFWFKRTEICQVIEGWIHQADDNERPKIISAYGKLRSELALLKPPKGMESFQIEPFSPNIPF